MIYHLISLSAQVKQVPTVVALLRMELNLV